MENSGQEVVSIISDMHLGHTKSLFRDEVFSKIKEVAAESDILVINGDGLDILEYIEAANDLGLSKKEKFAGSRAIIEFVKSKFSELIDSAPNTKFVYVKGNHEENDYAEEVLDFLKNKYGDKIEICNNYHKGEIFCVHGRKEIDKSMKFDRAVFYQKFFELLLEWVELPENVKHIFSGHSHKAEEGIKLENGIYCHNSGAYFGYSKSIIFQCNFAGGKLESITSKKLEISISSASR